MAIKCLIPSILKSIVGDCERPKKAFEHLMKTKVGPDEKIPDELLEKINTSLSSYKTENKQPCQVKDIIQFSINYFSFV